MKSTYQDWLELQQFAVGTVQAQMHRAGRIEECYGDLDEHYSRDQLRSVIGELKYSTEDERRNKPNPSQIPFNGKIRNNLATYRHATELYCKFRRDTGEDEVVSSISTLQTAVSEEAIDEHGQRMGLERDLQRALRHSIEQLEPGMEIIDEGVERSVSSGFIDITARDARGAIVIIELKAGTARQKAVGQILSYMGDMVDEEPNADVRGILVASDFDKKARAAARMVPSLSLQTYRVNFQFANADDAPI